MSWCKSESYLLLINNEEKPKTLTPFPHPPILLPPWIEILQTAKSEIHTSIPRGGSQLETPTYALALAMSFYFF